MKPSVPNRLVALCIGTALMLVPQALKACATCYGASDAPMAQGMNWGIMTLLAVIGLVLGSIASFFVFIGWRTLRMSSSAAPTATQSDL